ncbi:hypothetical protein IWQ56_000055 [Coemansia nantahalensis]|uniref:Uncharacterized protein n=1 Tax=Coemansia nantahalensis TaxID=2789366 RepID=A0ACC1JZZ6_9FUNG|nr:hypothetical protein IWQ57_002560 [Coemansia nantahalensis]KAJ2775417.1 hypothetical protein IWQ56_000055 [Coemansia nantahalensis]
MDDNYRAQLQGKVVLVTGAASGIGKALCEHLVGLDAKVFLVDVNQRIEQQAESLNQERADSAGWFACDLCQLQHIQAAFDSALAHFGQVDIVVNNAGIANSRSLFSQPDHSELEQIVRINLLAPMEATRIAVRYFRDAKRTGVVVNTASVGGLLPLSVMESYGTTKAALIFFTRTCRSLAPLIRVNAVAPYFARTPLVATNRIVSQYPLIQAVGLMHPAKVVRAMLKAMCDESVCGDTLMVSMGCRPAKVAFYDELALDVTSYIVKGTVRKYASAFSKLFMRALDGTIGALRKRAPGAET